MKTLVRFRPLDEYRRWIVLKPNSITYFPTWGEAIRYALQRS